MNNIHTNSLHPGAENDNPVAEEQKEHKSLVPKEVKEFFAADKFAVKLTGIEIEEASQNYARCSLHITDDHRNLAGDVMGGVLFTLADFSFAVASNRKNRYTTTLTSEIRFMKKTKGEYLYSECRVVRDGSRVCFADAVITDKTGAEVAAVSFSGMHLSPTQQGGDAYRT